MELFIARDPRFPEFSWILVSHWPETMQTRVLFIPMSFAPVIVTAELHDAKEASSYSFEYTATPWSKIIIQCMAIS